MLCFALLLSIFLPIAFLEETCDENCKFTDRYITPESIKNWPVTCKKVCGNIFINANTSLTEKQLKEKFKKLTDLVGNIEIQYTELTSLNFLSQKLNLYPGSNGVAIRLNANLTNVTAIGSWTAKTWTRWHIYYNPKLDMTPFCDRALHIPNMDFNVYGNLKNCGCKNVRIGPSSLKSYSNCTSIDGGVQNGLLITQVNDTMDLSGLLKLQSITGRLEIYQTNLTNLSFLDNLEIINMTVSEEMNIIDIWSNSKLTKLGFGSLKKLIPGSQKLRISFAFNNPALCITTNELQLLAEHNVELYMDPTLNLCPDLDRKDGEKVCKFDDLESLDPDCQHVMRDVLVDSNNEKFAPNLGNVTNIYGSLMVKGTKELTSLDFLENLQQVANFTVDRNDPLIQISSNEKLQSVSFPSMKFPLYPYSKDFQVIKINDNTLDIFKDPDQCKKLEKSTKTEIEYNDKGCDHITPGGDEEQKTGDDSNIKLSDGPNTEPSKKSSEGCWNLRATVLLLLYLL
ncbi:unnamed protein product [Caenorhabditis brenneri]